MAGDEGAELPKPPNRGLTQPSEATGGASSAFQEATDKALKSLEERPEGSPNPLFQLDDCLKSAEERLVSSNQVDFDKFKMSRDVRWGQERLREFGRRVQSSLKDIISKSKANGETIDEEEAARRLYPDGAAAEPVKLVEYDHILPVDAVLKELGIEKKDPGDPSRGTSENLTWDRGRYRENVQKLSNSRLRIEGLPTKIDGVTATLETGRRSYVEVNLSPSVLRQIAKGPDVLRPLRSKVHPKLAGFDQSRIDPRYRIA